MKSYKRTAVALSILGLAAHYASAQTASCTSGAECVQTGSSYGPGSPVVLSQNAGSILRFTAADVEITTSGGSQRGITADNNGSIVFEGNLKVSPLARTTTQSIIYPTNGGTIRVGGNFDITAETGGAGAPGIMYMMNGNFIVDGNANMTLLANSDQGTMVQLNSGSVFSVGGKAVLTNLSSNNTTLVLSAQDTSKASFNELEINTNAAQGLIAGGTASVISTGTTTITANKAYSSGIWINGYGLVSLGESAAVTQQMENSRAGIAQVNIGANAKVSGDYALNVLSGAPNTVITIKGIVDSDVYAVYSSSVNTKQSVWIDGGQVRGDITLFQGDDSFKITSGTFNGNIYMGDGDDYVEIAGGKVTGQLYMGSGQDSATIKGNPDVSGVVIFNGGSDGTATSTGALSFSGSEMSARSFDGTGLFIYGWDTLNLTNGTRLTMTGANILSASTGLANNHVNIDSTSTLLHDPATSSQTIIATVNNAGHMTMGNNLAVGDTWTIQGNYVGNNGLVTFDTTLDGDLSPTDKLVIQGDTSGTTRVRVNNVGGVGALTQGGIEIIEVQGQSDGTFVQDGRIVAGAYDYKLDRGNTANGTNGANWYLTSYDSPLVLVPGPDTEDSKVITPVVKPTVRPEAGAYLGLMEHNRAAFSHSFHDRQQLLNNQYESSWGRIEYSEIKTRAGFDDQLSNKVQSTLLHVGTDVYQDEIFHFGVMGAYSRGDVTSRSRVTGFTADGKSDGYSLGVYATWFNQDKANDKPYEGYYVDTYAQYNWFNNKVNGQGLPQERYRTDGFTLSAETGYSFLLGEQDQNQAIWTLEPQAQVIYSRMDGSDHWESNGTRVHIGKSGGLTGRIGLRVQRHHEEGLQPFATLNYWYGERQESLQMSYVPVESNRSRHLLELKIGAQTPISENWQIYGQLQGVIGENSTRGYGANAGLRYSW